MGLYRGGRKKGSKNRNTDLHAKCAEMNVDVFKEMLTMALEENDKSKRFNRFKELAQYLYAKPKEVELSADQVTAYLEAVANNDSTRSA